MQIENDRRAEDEGRQKDLTNAPLRMALFELVNNACTLLAQAELDRWTGTRTLLVDFNQIVSDVELVPPLPHRKLTLLVDTARSGQKRGQKKPARGTPTGRTRGEAQKLQPFEAPIFEQFDAVKKFMSDASVVYLRSTSPVSTRASRRPAKDKNPFAAHKISPLEEFGAAFADDDVYFGHRIVEIGDLARETIRVVQQSFDAFVEDSNHWIQSNYTKRKTIVDTALAYFFGKVNEEAQLNHLVLLTDNSCVIDCTQLLAPNEEVPKIPPAFPAALTGDTSGLPPEEFVRNVVAFVNETNAP
jgi:hypothetical protein